jgi:hypothetical protein
MTDNMDARCIVCNCLQMMAPTNTPICWQCQQGDIQENYIVGLKAQSDIDTANIQAADNVTELALLREQKLITENAQLLAVATAAAEYVHSADDATLGVLCHEVAEWEAGQAV